ncbi:MAG: polymer-forming cytoskeletal protein [Planctomycetales bacterium]|nr:polymer-forming cytoskeletal protein [Planctomycetales bacterium]
MIHKDATFKGDLSFEGTIRIEGRYEGKIAAKGRLVVGRGASVVSDATVGQAFIEGVFKGNVTALENVELAATAQVSGDITSPRLVVADGAVLVGKCSISRDGKPPEAPKK